MRFRTTRGRMLVIAPGDPPEFKAVNIVYDKANDMYGIQLIGASELQGYCFFVSRQVFAATLQSGTLTAELPAIS